MFVSGDNKGFAELEPLTDSDLIPIETDISSPNMDVAESMKVGDALKVALHFSGDSTVVVVMHKGQVAGEITTPLAQRLPEYMVRGTDYTATLVSKEGGCFIVLIKAIK